MLKAVIIMFILTNMENNRRNKKQFKLVLSFS